MNVSKRLAAAVLFTIILVTQPLLASEQIEFVEVGDDVSSNEKAFGFGKGATWKLWNKLHKECMKAQWVKKPYYFGVSNTLSLGAIVSNRYEPVNGMTNYYFTDTQLASLKDPGSPANCTEEQSVKVDFNAMMSSTQLDTELSTAIKNSSSITASIDSWQVQNLYTDRLKEILNNDKTNKTNGYKRSLLTKGNKILVKVIKVNGFTSLIKLKTDMSASLRATLDQGITERMGSTNLNVKFEYINDRTISMKTSGQFYVFGQYMKAKRIKL